MLAEKMKKAFNSIDKTAKIKTPVKEIKKVQVVAGWDVFCDNEHNAFDTIKEAIKKSNFNDKDVIKSKEVSCSIIYSQPFTKTFFII